DPISPAATHAHRPRALGNEASKREDYEREKPAHDERGAPAPRRAEQSRIEEKDCGERSAGGADPEASVHGQVDASAQVRRHELLNRRVDGRIFAAKAP